MQNRPFNKAPSSSLQRNLTLIILSCKCCPRTCCWQSLAESHQFPWGRAKAGGKLVKDSWQSSDKYNKAESAWFCSQFHGCEPEGIRRRAVFSVASRTIKAALLLPKARGPSSPPSPIRLLSYHPCNHLFSKPVIGSLSHLFSCESYFMI